MKDILLSIYVGFSIVLIPLAALIFGTAGFTIAMAAFFVLGFLIAEKEED